MGVLVARHHRTSFAGVESVRRPPESEREEGLCSDSQGDTVFRIGWVEESTSTRTYL